MSIKTVEDVTALLKAIREDRAVGSAEIPGNVEANASTPYQIIRVRAQERVRENEALYRFFVESHIGVILTHGTPEEQKLFAKYAEDNGQTYTVNSLGIYRKLVMSAYALMGGTGHFTPHQIADINGSLRLLTRSDLGIFRFRDPELSWIMKYSITSLDDLAEKVRISVHRTSGWLLESKVIATEVVREALAHPIPRLVLPTVVMETAPDEVAGYESQFPGKVIAVDVSGVTEETVEEAVTNAFNSLVNKLK